MPFLVRATKSAASLALSGSSQLLGAASRLAQAAAEAVRPDDRPVSREARAVVESFEERGRVVERAPAENAEITRARVPATHVAELADRPAAEVVEAVDDLSTDELRLLLEHEQANRRRKTVLAAIEQAAAAHAGA
jgi:hypothetical protein